MPKGKIRVLSTVPGSTHLGPIIRDFCKKPEGYVTAFSDPALQIARRFVEDDHPVEVKPFGEIVREVLELCGEPALRIAGTAELTEAVSYACLDLPEGSPFGRTARFPGLHQALVRTLKELHEWGIDPPTMQRLVHLASPRLAAKLESLAHIDRACETIMESLGRQSHSAHLASCLGCTPERDGGFERLLVVGGSQFSPLRLDWLRWVAEQGTEVTLVLDRHAGGAPLFAGAERTLRYLGVAPEPVGDATRLIRNLFFSDAAEGPETQVAILSMADPLAEAEWALRGCIEEETFDEAAIFVRNLEEYAPLIEAASRRLEVPIRMLRRVPLLTNPFARLTLTLLEVLSGNDVRALSPVIKSSYLGLSCSEQNRVITGLRQAHSTKSKQWEELSQLAKSQELGTWIEELLDWRTKALHERYELRDWHALLRELMNSEALPWSIKRQQGHAHLTQRDQRARNQMERLLTNHITVDVLTRRSSASLHEMVAICRELWQEADVSVPSEESGVLVTDQTDALTDANRLHIMGMLEGVFPRRRSEEPILTDAERAEISTLCPGRPALLNSHDRSAEERDAFYRACAAARKKLVCSYPQADDQRDNIPAFYLNEVARAAGKIQRVDLPRLSLAPRLPNCHTRADQVLRSAREAPREYPVSLELFSETAREALRPLPGHRYSPNELREALRCPFRQAMRYRVGIDPKRRRGRWQRLGQLPRISNLAGQADLATAERALHQALEAELDLLYSDVDPWEMQLLRAGGRRLIGEWLAREDRARSCWTKTPQTLRTNVPFYDPDLRNVFPGKIEIQGQLPALSEHRRYRVAHLYDLQVGDIKKPTDIERFYLGLYFLLLYNANYEGALEIESMSGRRDLILLTRQGGNVVGHAQSGLHVTDLSQADDHALGRRLLFEHVRKLLREAVDTINRPDINAVRGDHCDGCDFAELCRRSKNFGEEDSPFGADLDLDADLEVEDE